MARPNMRLKIGRLRFRTPKLCIHADNPVTGRAGFISSCFIRCWLEAERGTVVNIDNLKFAGNEAILRLVQAGPRYRFAQVGITDGPRLRHVLREYQPLNIVPSAADSDVDRSNMDGLRLTIARYRNHGECVEAVTGGAASTRLGISEQPPRTTS